MLADGKIKKKRKKKFLFNMALIHCLQTNIIKFYFITWWYAFGQCQFMKKERHLTILRRSSCLTFCLFEQYVIVRRFVISLMFWNTFSLNPAKYCIDTFFISQVLFLKRKGFDLWYFKIDLKSLKVRLLFLFSLSQL